MPSKSKAQQRFFGMVDAYKKGEMKNPSSKIKKAAKGMSMSDVKDFAETKHKGLPEKVEENMEKRIIRMTESDLHQLVKESVNRILSEIQFGGESLHGDNPEDWAAVKHLRTDRINREGDAGLYDDDESGYFRNLRNWERNGKNEIDLLDKMYPHDYSKFFERGRALDAKGHNKANRIGQNLAN